MNTSPWRIVSISLMRHSFPPFFISFIIVALLAMLLPMNRAGAQEPVPREQSGGILQFSAPVYVAKENGKAVRITVKRSGGSFGATTVTYSTADGTARADEDYTSTTGELVLPAGLKSKSFNIPILRDDVPDGGETIIVSLDALSGSATFGDRTTAVVVIAENKVALSRKRASPGQDLIVRGRFDPTVPVYVSFNDFHGEEVVVRAEPLSARAVRVKVPLFFDGMTLLPTGGKVGVSLIQESGVFGPVANFVIGELAESEEPTGTFTVEFLKQMRALSLLASQTWLNLETQSNGAFDSSTLRSALQTQADFLAEAQGEIEALASGSVNSIALGKLADRDVVLDAAGLALLDRIVRASFLDGRPAGAPALQPVRAWARLERAAQRDALTDFKDTFRLDLAADPKELFAQFDKINTIGSLAIGLGATGAVVLAGIPIATAAAFAGTAGAVLYFAAYVAPATMGYMTYGMAADFVALQTGRPPEFDTAQPALDHLYKGSTSFIQDELQGRLIAGTLERFAATPEFVERTNLALSTSKTILDLTNPDETGSLTRQAYAHADTIFENRPLPEVSVEDVLVTEPLTGTTAATFLITLSRESSDDVVVRFHTASRSAVIGDYVDKSGSIVIPAGKRSKTVSISILGDDQFEPDETFVLELSGADHATLAKNIGTGTIRDSRLQWTIAGSFSANGETTSFSRTAAFARNGGSITFPAGRATVRVTITKTSVAVTGSGFGGEEGVSCTGTGGGKGPIVESSTGFSAAGAISGNIHCVFDDGSADNYPVTGSFTATAPK